MHDCLGRALWYICTLPPAVAAVLDGLRSETLGNESVGIPDPCRIGNNAKHEAQPWGSALHSDMFCRVGGQVQVVVKAARSWRQRVRGNMFDRYTVGIEFRCGQERLGIPSASPASGQEWVRERMVIGRSCSASRRQVKSEVSFSPSPNQRLQISNSCCIRRVSSKD